MGHVPPISGLCDPRFAAVRDALVTNFREHGERGAAVAVTVAGRPVVDLWAGWTDRAGTRPWQRDTLVNVFSVGKPIAALGLLALVEQGRVDLDAPVARYWPGFDAHGKGGVTVRMVLAHRAGLPAIRAPLPAVAMFDGQRMARALVDETPWWEPGTAHGYHVNTLGYLVGELVRRVSGETVGAFVRRAVAGPLGADFHFGLRTADDARVAECLVPDDDATIADYLFAGEPAADDERREFIRRVYFNPPGVSGFGTVNTRAWRAAEMPSTNAHATARAVARIYAALAAGGGLDGARLIAADTLAAALGEASSGPDLVLGRPSRFGLGFQLNLPDCPLGPGARSFGHFGAGGSVGFADPDADLAFAYTMSLPGARGRNPRTRGLIDATYSSLTR